MAPAFLLAALILSLTVLGVSPGLHKLIHSDADTVDHNCAITLFAKGQITRTDIATFAFGLMLIWGCIALLADTFLIPSQAHQISSSRAPPTSAFFLV